MAVDWGSVPDWLAGSAALLALIFAGIAALAARRTNHIQSIQIQELQEENRQRRMAERREMASRVSVYLVTEDTPSGKQPIVRFVNANPGPIYGLHVFCFTPARVVDRRYYVNGPHPERVRMAHLTERVRELVGPTEAGDLIGRGLLVAACSFRDPAGIWWYRTPSGELFEASSGEAAAEAARASGPATSNSGAGPG